MERTTRPLGEICDDVGGIIKTGPFGSQLHQSDYSEVGTPVVMPKDIIGGRISEGGIARIGDNHVQRLSQHKLKLGDIVYGRRGDIGRCALITQKETDWLCGTGCLRVSLGNSPLSPRFLYYFLCQPSVIAWITNQAVGATMPNLNTSILRSVPIAYPDLPSQLRIASVLSAYDDLIENNTRRIAILEDMARMVYQEWFVSFRFPDHEQVPMVESEQGPIPEGWEVRRLDQVAEVNGSSITPRNAPDIIHYIDIASVAPGRVDQVQTMDFSDAPSRARRRVKAWDIIWSCVRPNRRSHALLVDPIPDTIASTGFAVISASGVPPIFLYQALTTDDFVGYLVNHATGAAYPAVPQAVFEAAKIVVPSDTTLARFDEATQPMARLADNLHKKNINLRTQRDLLLPKLISGEIDVSELDVVATESHAA